ncbi:hypothetical protein [Lacibacter sediminis]|uniref:Uncharacterized protein n=1 Tax=Lacibacter sediminis TaxID=2760713 RepID=A0A7G5XGC1_9BACT|nr:hypothetical protein [Lacibacter sediminis]QNA44524.1 hypothetical protein H4075_21105 [Lacibacter sediminis]
MKRILFPHIEKWLLLLIPFVAIGFYPGYWSKILTNKSTTIQHVHAFFMSLWVIMSIVQPWLIMKKKTQIHKVVGKVSYVLIPFIIISGYILIQARYERILLRVQDKVTTGELKLTAQEVLDRVASSQTIGILFLLMLIIFYTLAIVNRKKFLHHATYMLGAIFTSIDPALDRMIGHWAKANNIEPNFFIDYGSQLFALVLLVALAVYQRSKKQSLKPVSIVIGIYSICFLINDLASETAIWRWFVEAFLFR